MVTRKVVGYYDMGAGQGVLSQVPAIQTAGLTDQQLLDLNSTDLNGVDILLVQNGDNGGYGAEFTSRISAIQNAVANGMTLVIHDRHVENAESILPGFSASLNNVHSDFADGKNINVADNSTKVTNGPGGIINNSTLDYGYYSNHGFTDVATLPAGAKTILTTGDPNHAVTFSYQYGAGQVIYSSIPLDYYLNGENPAGFRQVYAPNILAYANDPTPVVVNNPPTVSDFNKVGSEDTVISFSSSDFSDQFVDADSNNLSKIIILSLPSGGTLKLGTDVVTLNQEIAVANLDNLSFTPNSDFNGTVSFDWNGFDGTTYAENDAKVNLTIDSINDLPFVVIGKPSATEDSPFNYEVNPELFDDPDVPESDILSYTATLQNDAPLPDWLSFDPNTLTLSGTPANSDVGKIRVEVTATDTTGGTASGILKLEVVNTNDVPTLATEIEDQMAIEDLGFNFTVPANTFADEDLGDSLTYSATLDNGNELPEWLTFDAETRAFSGTPTNDNVGDIDITVAAEDNAGVTVIDTFNLEVANANDAPIVDSEISDQTATEDEAYTFSLPEDTFTDVDFGDSLTYSAALEGGEGGEPLPDWLSFDAETLTFSGTPTNDYVGEIAVTVTAVDNSEAAVSDTFNLEVVNTNDAPVVATPIPEQTINENIVVNFSIDEDTFSDEDPNDSLSYSASMSDGTPLPAWLSFNAETLTFSSSPSAPNGDYGVKVTATDILGATADTTFNLKIDLLNMIEGTSASEEFTTTPIKDLINAAGGNDLIISTLANLKQQDLINGGADTDTLRLTSDQATDTVSIDLTNETSQLIGIADTKVVNFERFGFTGFAGTINFQGAASTDVVLGGGGADSLVGAGNNDAFIGNGGNDTLIGDTGSDQLTGNDGNDSISGGADSDLLTGSGGNDILIGGTGSDRFMFDINAAFNGTVMGMDHINDFTPGADKIVLDKSTFKSLVSNAGAGFSKATEFATVTSNAAAATSSALIVYNSTTDALFYNQNGVAQGLGSGNQFAVVDDVSAVTASDFLIEV